MIIWRPCYCFFFSLSISNFCFYQFSLLNDWISNDNHNCKSHVNSYVYQRNTYTQPKNRYCNGSYFFIYTYVCTHTYLLFFRLSTKCVVFPSLLLKWHWSVLFSFLVSFIAVVVAVPIVINEKLTGLACIVSCVCVFYFVIFLILMCSVK